MPIVYTLSALAGFSVFSWINVEQSKTNRLIAEGQVPLTTSLTRPLTLVAISGITFLVFTLQKK